MTDDIELTHSALECKVTRDGITVEIFIYRGPNDTGWLLELQDHAGGSTVWDDPFETDHEALEAAMGAIDEDGIASFAEANGAQRSG